MVEFDRRSVVATLAALSVNATQPGWAQTPRPTQSELTAPPTVAKFSFEDVQRRARELASAPLAPISVLPEPLKTLDFEAWRDIRFRPERALLGASGGPFRLQTFHLGHLFKQPVTVNTIRDGMATPIPYSANLFDYGRTKIERPLPVNLGFAGFRLHYPLNDPRVYDEAIAFLGASYFRFLGRSQRYGLSARALAVNAGTEQEEFPFFREFWIETPEAGSDRATIYALLDGESVSGAYRFDLWPGVDSVLEVSATLFARRPGVKLGLAPLTSMFFIGENDRRTNSEYRPEVHDSDGLLVNTRAGEWIWRQLRNPEKLAVSTFVDKDVRGFGLFQRDRSFEHYQDLDLAYERRPSYWVEPINGWGEGRVELVELPTTDETNDNIVAMWAPNETPEPGKAFNFSYRVTTSLEQARYSPNGRAINTYQTQARSLGAREPVTPFSRRFIIDFAGGDLAYFLNDLPNVELVPSTAAGTILRSSLMQNAHTKGFRAIIDVQLEAGQSTDLRAFLRSGNRTLTETWTFPWKAVE